MPGPHVTYAQEALPDIDGETEGFEQRLLELKKEKDKSDSDSVAIVSGGLDSTTLVYRMIRDGFTPHLLSFNYGQRHKKELTYAGLTARTLGLKHDIVDLTGITNLISNSSLTGGKKVPDGHYAEESMKDTVVPNRNMIMLSIAAGVAVNNKYRKIGIGVHGGDHFIYPDCRPIFLEYAGRTIWYGNEDFHAFEADDDWGPLYAPYLNGTKADIAYEAIMLGVPLHLTWSCYKGGDIHCGRCGTCVERLEAIDEAQMRIAKNPPSDWENPYPMQDHTVYADDEFWKTARAEGSDS